MSRHDLSTPRPPRRSIGLSYDPDAFGQFAEGVARFIGTARFLVFQSGVIVVWISVNTFVPFDGSQLQLLTLLLSLQAAYAAPLILLAQNRQEQRDRVQVETDRDINARTQADTEFLARELASVRLGTVRRRDHGGSARSPRRPGRGGGTARREGRRAVTRHGQPGASAGAGSRLTTSSTSRRVAFENNDGWTNEHR